MSIYYIVAVVILIIGLLIYYFNSRNYFNKYKYMRVVSYNENKTITINYHKLDTFNKNNEILINPDHVFIYKGYVSVLITSKSRESITPLDFNAKYDSVMYETAIGSKVIKDALGTLKVDKFDKITMLLILAGIQLLAIAYLVYVLVGGLSG